MAKVMEVEKPRDFDPPAHWAIVGTGSGKCVLQFFAIFLVRCCAELGKIVRKSKEIGNKWHSYIHKKTLIFSDLY